MRRRLTWLAFLLALAQIGAFAQGQGPAIRRAARPVPGQYIVVLATSDDSQAVGLATQQLYRGRLRHVYKEAVNGFAIQLDPSAAAALARDPRVLFVEEDGLMQATDAQNSPPWGLDRIDQRVLPLDTVYNYPAAATPVHVHVLDSGIRATHVDFGGRADVAADYIDDDNDGDPLDIGNDDGTPGTPDGADCNGHGTHVSGTIAGNTYGVAKHALVHAHRVLNCAGTGPTSGIIAALNAVVVDGRRPAVINMSLGGGISSSLDSAVRGAITNGVTVVVAAGNEDLNANTSSPARVVEAITVAATDINDNRASFSNFGSVVDLFAPGVSVLSAYYTSNTAAATASGTSMASPHVAGVAALYLEQNGDRLPAVVRDAIVAEATPGVVVNPGSGSPNRLLYSAFTIPITGSGLNVAAAANGGTVTASSSYSGGYPASAVINGDRRGINYGSGGVWHDATGGVYPDWVEITFAGSRNIDEVAVFTVQNAWSAPSEPTPSMTWSQWGVNDFTVQYWTGSAWGTVPGGVIRNNNLVWRSITFAPITTTKIRVLAERAADGWSRLTEVEAYQSDGGPVNTPPSVNITSPVEGATAGAPASFTVSANATDLEGPVNSVAFYANGVLIASDNTSPFSVPWNDVAAGAYTLTAVATDGGGLTTTSAEVHVTVTAPTSGSVNVAAASRGATVTASSSYSSAYPAAALINGDRRGINYGGGGVWHDATSAVYPDTVTITFAGSRTIDGVSVFTVQNAWNAPSEPTPSMTWSQWGVNDFTVQYLDGATWQTLPGGIIRNNNLVWRTITFAPIATTAIRVIAERAADGWSRLTEIEAYQDEDGGPVNTAPNVNITNPAEGASALAPANFTVEASASDAEGPVASVAFYANGGLIALDNTSPFSVPWNNVVAGSYTLTAIATDGGGLTRTSAEVHVTVTNPTAGRVNVAAAAQGGTVTASSSYAPTYPAAAVINGDRRGHVYGAGGVWHDATGGVYPDTVEITFAGDRLIDEVDVFTIQDAWNAPSEPTPSMTWSQWGVNDFTVQYFNGTAWQTVPGGVIRNNNLVWRSITFAPIVASRIRVIAERAADGWSRLAEVEAWEVAP